MGGNRVTAFVERTIGAVLLLIVLAIGLDQRLLDPLSTPVVSAEDPLTHVVLIREDVSRGYFANSQALNMSMYPPGLHGYMGSAWMLSGFDLYQSAIWAPVFFSLLGLAVVFLFAHRFGGLAAAFTSTLLLAVFPEVVFRSVLFSPTALDLALLPLIAWMSAEALEGNLDALYAVGILGASLAFAHPWVLGIVTAAGLAVLVLHEQLAPNEVPAQAKARALLALLFAFLGVLGFVFANSSDQDKGIAKGMIPIVAGGLLLAATFWAEYRGTFRVPRFAKLVRSHLGALAAGAVLALLAYFAMIAIIPSQLPTNVDFDLMLGPAAGVAAFAGLALFFEARNQLAAWGAALTILLFPFTAENLLNLWYLPSRTVVFLAFGIAFLGGAAAQVVVELGTAVVARWRPNVRPFVAIGLALVLVVVATPPIEAATPNHPYTWYRLYTPDQFAGLQWVANESQVNAPNWVLVGSWQANLFVRALGAPGGHVADDQLFFTGQTRGEWLKWAAPNHLFVVVDLYTRNATGDPFASNSQFQAVWSCSCGTMTVYQWRG